MPESVLEHLRERILDRILIDDSGCLLWIGYTTSNGYAGICHQYKNIPVHRVTYELVNGPIPDGLVIDHLCRVRNCVNPRHLEAVTNKENILRGVGPTAQNARQTHCKRGHPLSGENLRFSKGGRVCRVCANATLKRVNAARRAASPLHWKN